MEELDVLYTKLNSTQDFFDRMEIEDDIRALKIKLGLITSSDYQDPYIECIGCGS